MAESQKGRAIERLREAFAAQDGVDALCPALPALLAVVREMDREIEELKEAIVSLAIAMQGHEEVYCHARRDGGENGN